VNPSPTTDKLNISDIVYLYYVAHPKPLKTIYE
jgi:hypothetical protein